MSIFRIDHDQHEQLNKMLDGKVSVSRGMIKGDSLRNLRDFLIVKRDELMEEVEKHGSHDQSTHSPTGQAAKKPQQGQKKPRRNLGNLSGSSSPAPTKVKLRNAVNQKLAPVVRDVDTILDAYDLGDRAVRRLKTATKNLNEAVNAFNAGYKKGRKVDISGLLKPFQPKKQNKMAKAADVLSEARAAIKAFEASADDLTDSEKKQLDELRSVVDQIESQVEQAVEAEKVSKRAIEKGIGHTLDLLEDIEEFIESQEPQAELSDEDQTRLNELATELEGIVGYFNQVEEQGHFEE